MLFRSYLGEKGYLKMLDINDLVGTWSGTMTITELSYDEEFIENLRASLPENDDYGCDQTTIDQYIQQAIDYEGKSFALSVIVSVSDNIVTMTTYDADDPALNKTDTMHLSVVMGHVHSVAGIHWGAGPEQRWFGMDVGCLIDRRAWQFAYGKHMKKKPI